MFTPLVYWNYSGWFSDFRSLLVDSRVSHLQLVSGRWFPDCSVWWGSVALDHHSIQRSVYPRLSNKSFPVPVCLAPQIHNLLSRSSPPFSLSSSPLLLPRRDPPLLFCVQRGRPLSHETKESCVFLTDEVNQRGPDSLATSRRVATATGACFLFALWAHADWETLFVSGSQTLQAFGWQKVIPLSTAHSSGKRVQLILLLDMIWTQIRARSQLKSEIHWAVIQGKMSPMIHSILKFLNGKYTTNMGRSGGT